MGEQNELRPSSVGDHGGMSNHHSPCLTDHALAGGFKMAKRLPCGLSKVEEMAGEARGAVTCLFLPHSRGGEWWEGKTAGG